MKIIAYKGISATALTVKGQRFVYFRAEAKRPITEAEALTIQKLADYHPAGYGFYRFVSGQERGEYVALWECSSSCD